MNSSNNTSTPKIGARQPAETHLSGPWAFPVVTSSRVLSISGSRLKRSIFTRSGGLNTLQRKIGTAFRFCAPLHRYQIQCGENPPSFY